MSKINYKKMNENFKKFLMEGTDVVSNDEKIILVSDYIKNHIMEHNKIGIGSIFRKGITEQEIKSYVEKVIDQVSEKQSAYELKIPKVGYNLVLTIDKAKKLNNAKETTVEKKEGPNTIKVPAIQTSMPLDTFKTDILTLIIRPANKQFLPDDIKSNNDILKKIDEGTCYALITAFPGDPNIPKASEWNGKYAVILPVSE